MRECEIHQKKPEKNSVYAIFPSNKRCRSQKSGPVYFCQFFLPKILLFEKNGKSYFLPEAAFC